MLYGLQPTHKEPAYAVVADFRALRDFSSPLPFTSGWMELQIMLFDWGRPWINDSFTSTITTTTNGDDASVCGEEVERGGGEGDFLLFLLS